MKGGSKTERAPRNRTVALSGTEADAYRRKFFADRAPETLASKTNVIISGDAFAFLSKLHLYHLRQWALRIPLARLTGAPITGSAAKSDWNFRYSS